MFAVNPGVLAAGNAVDRYPQFEAYITALATGGVRDWTSTASWGAGGASFITTAAAPSGPMIGSSWLSEFRRGTGNTAACRVVQHGLPRFSVFNEQVSAGYKIFLRIQATTAGPTFVGLNRNGFESSSSASTGSGSKCVELIRWDGSQAWISDPSTGSAETLYTDWM